MRMDDTPLLSLALPFLEAENQGPLDETTMARVLKAVPTLKPRAKTLKEFAEQAKYLLLKRPLEISGKSAKPLRKADAMMHLSTLTNELKSLEDIEWSEGSIQTLLQNYATTHNIGFGKIGQPVRAALTGGSPSPDLSWVLALLGKQETLGRLTDIIDGEFNKE